MGTAASYSSVPQRSVTRRPKRHLLLVGVRPAHSRRLLEPSPITPRPTGRFYTALAVATCLCAPIWGIVAVVIYFATQ
jgi:hypothetical protein